MNFTSAAEVDLIDNKAYFTAEPLYGEFIVSPTYIKIDAINVLFIQTTELKIELKGGLLAAIGAWEDYDGIDEFVEDIYRKREKAFDRSVAL
ncbi:MAG: hypothetical protein Q8P28_06130 [Deltaproteobacteria bacterium]|nr:hypothetical protein [Deltaproteobacteria bacterium]